MVTTLEANNRTYLNKSGLKELRVSGRLPAVVFGKQLENKLIHVSAKQFQKWMRQGMSGMIMLQIEDEQPINVLLEDIQRDAVTREPVHVDFQQVQKDTVIRTKLPIMFKGIPAGTKQGGTVQVQQAFIEVEALPMDLPTEIVHDVSEMNIGETILVEHIQLSSAIKVVSEPNELLYSVVK